MIRKRKISLVSIFMGMVLAVLAFLAVYPLFFLLIGSLTGKAELKSMIGPVLTGKEGYADFPLFILYPTLQAYVEILLDTPEFFVMFWNSAKLTFGILLGQLLVAVPAAWGFARGRFPGRKILFTLYILLMMMPFQVLMLSDYLVLDDLQLLDTQLGIVLLAAFSPFPVFLMERFFAGIPQGLLEAARLDGASEWKIFWYVGIPLGANGIVAAMILGFLEYWNLIEQPMTFLKTRSLWPLSLYLPNINLDSASVAFVASVLALIPAILVFMAGQDYLERGIMAIAIKE